MAITNSLIVVIQNEPRDGDIVSVEKDEKAYRNRVVELDMVERESASEIVELGQTYWNDDDSSTIIGYEVQLPYQIRDLCPDCFFDAEQGGGFGHEVGEHMVINFVAEEHCQDCQEQLVDCKSCFKEHTVGDGCNKE
jgi:hypothetical protein